MSDVLFHSHEEMVTALAKDGNVILSELRPLDCHMLHMIMGVAGEVGELLDAIKKAVIYRKDIDVDNVVEELGDIEFYLEGLRQSMGIKRDDVIRGNLEKLSLRYHEKRFTNEQAQARADKKSNIPAGS